MVIHTAHGGIGTLREQFNQSGSTLVRMSRVMVALAAVMLGALPVVRLHAADTDPDPLASGPKPLVITSSVAPARRPQHTPAYVSYLDTRARLRESNPEWKAASEHKQDIRHEHAIVLTEEILPE